jgi:hypothetical protein
MNAQTTTLGAEAAFTTARRINRSLTASIEKRALQGMAVRAPG